MYIDRDLWYSSILVVRLFVSVLKCEMDAGCVHVDVSLLEFDTELGFLDLKETKYQMFG